MTDRIQDLRADRDLLLDRIVEMQSVIDGLQHQVDAIDDEIYALEVERHETDGELDAD